jgi:hypothetical protein
MGRPPIGARALTPAEKQRRYRERRAAKFGNKGTVTKPTAAAAVAKLEARVRKLQEHCANLHGVIDEQHRLHQEHHAKWVAYAEKVEPALKEAVARIREVEAENARLRKKPGAKKRQPGGKKPGRQLCDGRS